MKKNWCLKALWFVGLTILFAGPSDRALGADKPLVVHEWGTFTVLQNELGQPLPGINVNEEALPPFVHRLMPLSEFPFGTFVVNVVGCLCIGVLNGVAETRQIIGPELRLFLMIGLLGGFTTFSTFGYETLALIRDQ